LPAQISSLFGVTRASGTQIALHNKPAESVPSAEHPQRFHNEEKGNAYQPQYNSPAKVRLEAINAYSRMNTII
jgi:hypothetical protein